jgi:hypothetical protein
MQTNLITTSLLPEKLNKLIVIIILILPQFNERKVEKEENEKTQTKAQSSQKEMIVH